MKRGFGSDNHSGICPEVLEAIVRVNKEHALAYGDDEYCAVTEQTFRKQFGEQARVFFAFNGTGCNTLCIDAMVHSHEAVVCAETAHINVDECGAPQRVVGCRLLTVDTPDGKLTPELMKTRLHGFGFEHHSQPKLISITQPTELGTLYTLDEIKALVELAHEYNMYVHIDGARLGNAAVALGCTFKEMTTDLGVDAISFGGTKNGLISVLISSIAASKPCSFVQRCVSLPPSSMRISRTTYGAEMPSIRIGWPSGCTKR